MIVTAHFLDDQVALNVTFPVQRYPTMNGFKVPVNGGSSEIDFTIDGFDVATNL